MADCLNLEAIKLISKNLRADVGIPTKLEKMKEDLDFLAQSAADACAPGNPKEATIEDFKALFRKLM